MKKSIILLIGVSLIAVCQESNSSLNSTTEKRVETKEPTKSNYSATYLECMSQSPNPNECIENELKIEDKKLNIAYQEAKKSIQPFRVNSLKEVQRAWIVYRDKKCEFFYHKESGSGGLTDALQCKLDETIQRTKELRIDNFENP